MSLALKLALRDLRGGLGGLRLLAICLFLGVAAIAGIGSLSAAIVSQLADEGRTILGGDIEVSLSQRQASPDERGTLERLGRLSETAKLNAMVSAPGGDPTLATLKAVDGNYPLYGRFALQPAALASRPGANQVVLSPELAERLRARVGQQVRIDEAPMTVVGIVATEPDKVGEGFGFGPTAIVSLQGLEATKLIQPGSLVRWRYRVALPQPANAGAIAERLRTANGEKGWRVKDSSDGAPSTRRSIERIGQFLTLVGLSALLIAGIGVGNGVSAYLDGKRATIATLKALGASSQLIFRIYLLQIGAVALVSIAAALVVGALVPGIVGAVAGDALPVAPVGGVHPWPLLLAAAFGLLIAFAFILAPLDRARTVGAASLFRGGVEQTRGRAWRVTAGMITAIGAAGGVAVASARDPLFAASVLGATGGLVLLLAAIGLGVRWLAAKLPRSRRPLVRLAIANLHAPGSQTARLVVALGLGLSLLTTLAVVQTNLSGELRSGVPEKAPSFFVLDIPSDRIGEFRAIAARAAPGGELRAVPSLRGPVVAVNGKRVADMKNLPEGAWFLRGDRGLTFAAEPQPGSRIVEGKWWPKDYAGPPLVSLDAEAGRALGLKIGDTLTISALGVEVPATIASFREIDWRSMGFNFAMVFSPGTFDGAPFNYMATLSAPPASEAAFNREVTRAFPSSSLIRVRDVIAAVGTILDQLATAVAAASAVAVAAGIAVLVGAVLAGQRARVYDAVLLKLLGATRGQVLRVQTIEYALLGSVVGLVSLAAGAGAGWYVVTRLLELPWAPDWAVVMATLFGGIATVLAIGLLGSLPALAARPAQALRTL